MTSGDDACHVFRPINSSPWRVQAATCSPGSHLPVTTTPLVESYSYYRSHRCNWDTKDRPVLAIIMTIPGRQANTQTDRQAAELLLRYFHESVQRIFIPPPPPIGEAVPLCFRVARVRPSVRPGVRPVSTISYKPMEGFSPNFGWWCSWGDRWTD